ncbi:LOW QUALITY PROTEIN: hydrolase, partial [Streptomyces sp. SPB78]
MPGAGCPSVRDDGAEVATRAPQPDDAVTRSDTHERGRPVAEPVAHLDWGGDGPPVLLLHGLAGYAGEWGPVAVRLRERGHRVLAMDLRGHGGSVRHPRDTSANAHADDVAGLLGRLGAGPAVLVGQSLGGRVALRVAVEHPSLVRGLALIEADARPASGAPGDAAIRWLRSWPLPFPDRASASGVARRGSGRGRVGGRARRARGRPPAALRRGRARPALRRPSPRALLARLDRARTARPAARRRARHPRPGGGAGHARRAARRLVPRGAGRRARRAPRTAGRRGRVPRRVPRGPRL